MNALRAFKREFQPAHLLPGITAGFVVVIADISTEISLAALIFSGDLSQFVGRGIGVILLGAAIMGVVVALATSIPGIIAVPQDTPAAILALVAAGIAAHMKLASPDAVYATVLAAIALTSLLMAACFLLLGWFKASGFVRYMPYPVVGGFLAGTGWLLAKGGFGVMVNVPLTFAAVPQFLGAETLVQWLPGVILAIVLLWMERRWNVYWSTPAALLLAIVFFYGTLLLAHMPAVEALRRGWLLGAFPARGLYQPLSSALIAQIDWRVIFLHLDQIASILVLSVVALLLNASGIELTFKQDVDLNRELVTAGYANLAAGMAGGLVGYQALSLSALAQRLGGRTRVVNLTFSLLCVVVLLFGGSLISYIPKFILGGMTIFLGLMFLAEWVLDTRRSLPTADYILIWIILGIIAVVGFLEGIAAGILIAALLFVINYSRLNAVRNVMSGQVFHSNVERPQAHHDLLVQRGAEIYILRLQGFIFFGTVEHILEKVRKRLADGSQPKMCYLVLDFQRVAQLDSSAIIEIRRLRQLAMANDFWMVWTQVAPDIQKQMKRGGLIAEQDDSFLILPTLDHGMEWCENKILAEQGIGQESGLSERIQTLLRRAFPSLQDVARLMNYLERKEVPQGEYLVRAGDPGDEMYFIEAGLLSAQLVTGSGKVVRLRSFGGGTTVGEIGLYLDTVRTASVVASLPSAVYRLTAGALTAMHAHDPDVAALLHEWIARLLAERLADNNRAIAALLE